MSYSLKYLRILRLHTNWLLYAVVGDSILTPEEVAELKAYGKLPMESLHLLDTAYFLGRARAVLKKAEYAALTAVPSAPLAPAEMLALDGARLKAVLRLRDLIASAFESKGKSWTSGILTIFQTLKVFGSAQAISNQHDIYTHSDGPNSLVSVIPAKNCCEDCTVMYVGSDGNPKVFKLIDLLSAGSNADPGTIHARTNGIHSQWKATLPPLHPNCGCMIMYVPPGYGWQAGKMTMLNKSLFTEHLSKATAGVSGGISPTVTPKGAPSTASPPGHPSVPGAAAPGNVAGPGRPPGVPKPPGAGSGGGSGAPQYMPCPFGGGADCIKHGGNGATAHKPNGAIMKKHQEAMASGAKPKTPEAIESQHKQFETAAAEYNARPVAHQVIHDHLSEGEIGAIRPLGGNEAGQNASYKISIKGNGSGLMKPPISMESYLPTVYAAQPGKLANKSPEELSAIADALTAPGAGTMSPGMSPHAEAGMSGLATGLGLGGTFPVTVIRTHDGSEGGPTGVTSVQHWQDNAVSVDKYIGDQKGSAYKAILKTAPPEHQDKLHEQFATIAVMDMITNNGDRHLGNIMVDTNTHDLIPIDHGTAFGNSLQGSRNGIAQELHSEGVALTIPPMLHEKLKAATVESTFRSLEESGLPDWAKAQTFLRTKYAVHMQENFDHIPFDRLRPTVTSRSGQLVPYWSAGSSNVLGWNDKGGMQGFIEAQEKKELPHDQFDSFAKTWIEQRVNDPSHPEHEDVKRLLAINPLRSSGHVTGKEAATPDSLKKHYDSIPSYDMSEPNAAQIKADMPRVKPGSVASTRTPPEMKTGVARPSKMEQKTGVAKPSKMASKTSTIELSDSDLEEVDPNKDYSPKAFERTGLQLDMSEFENKKSNIDEDVDAAFDRIRTKSVTKGLYIADPHAIFRPVRKEQP